MQPTISMEGRWVKDSILLGHGSGGILTHRLVREVFARNFGEVLKYGDKALLEISGELAYTTDSFVVNPLFFKGGDIGRLSVSGTVNDVITCGARPVAISASFILEEGLSMEVLYKIVESMREASEESSVRIITGDTKVVERGKCDGIYITTTGIGVKIAELNVSGRFLKPGDVIILTGDIGRHGAAVMAARLGIESEVESDCRPLIDLLEPISKVGEGVHAIRDPTRGGVATTLNEFAEESSVTIYIKEEEIPISEEVRGISELLGLDPLYLACEGRMVIVASEDSSDELLCELKKTDSARKAKVVGEVVKGEPRVILENEGGGRRIIQMLSGEQLPRIC